MKPDGRGLGLGGGAPARPRAPTAEELARADAVARRDHVVRARALQETALAALKQAVLELRYLGVYDPALDAAYAASEATTRAVAVAGELERRISK